MTQLLRSHLFFDGVTPQVQRRGSPVFVRSKQARYINRMLLYYLQYRFARVIVSGADSGQLSLFKNDYSSQASVNRTMDRIEIPHLRCKVRPDAQAVSAIRFLEEHVFVSASLDSTLRVWDCMNTRKVSELTAIESRDGLSAMEIVPNLGENLVMLTGSMSGSLCLRDLRSRNGEGDKMIQMGAHAICSLGMSENFIVASGDTSGCVELRDIRSLRTQPLLRFNGSKECLEVSQVKSVVSLPPFKPGRQDEISEDVWSIAMGKPTKKRSSMYQSNGNRSNVLLRTEDQVRNKVAHSDKVVLIQKAFSGIWITASEDRYVKVFSDSTGDVLNAIKLPNKPSGGAYFRESLFLVDRQGILRINDITEDDIQTSRIDNPHVGSVTTVCPSADWGLCTGGADQHVFLHSL